MTEQELLQQLAEAKKEYERLVRVQAAAKKRLMETETVLIEAKLHKERAEEALEKYRLTVPKYDPSQRDLEVEKFQQDHPELCEWAKQRDQNK
jgi:hypothetical protein